MGSSTATPLLSHFTPGVEATVLQNQTSTNHSKVNMKIKNKKDDYVASYFDLDSWVNNDKELKEDMDDHISFH